MDVAMFMFIPRSEHHFRIPIAGKERNVLLMGMYDGHSGFECSDVLRTQLPKYAIQEMLQQNSLDEISVKEALTTAFTRLDDDFRTIAVDPKYQYHPKAILPALAGAVTILSCFVDESVYVANAGDVRAVVGRQLPNGKFGAIALSEDHDADNPAERQRMFAEHPGEEEIVLANKRVLGGLQPTRSFGDR